MKRVNQVEKEESVLDEFKDVFQGLGRLKQKHSIILKPECEPVIHPARRVPYRLQEQFDKTLSDMESNKSITKITEPTEWVNPIVTVRKPPGALRICLDPLELNKAIRREHYSIPTPGEIVAKLHGSKYFSTLDATSGFLQIPLDDASSYVITFATPSGRYRFLCLPFGIKSAPEVFHRTIVEMFHDIEGVETYIDDILIYAPTEEEHDRRLRAVLQRCRDANLSLNKDKCVIKTQELKYLGHIISPDGVKADPAKVAAIVDMPVPESKEDVRRFIGLINYLSKYCPNLSSIAAPLRDLMKKDVGWSWNSNHQQAWLAVQGLIKANVELKLFDPTKPVVVTVDASQRGIGAALLQQGEPIEFASCSMTETQQRYAQIENEFLAIQFGLKRFHQYVYGQRVVVETDHMPLLGIIKKPISQISPRLQRMRLRIDPYDYELVYRPGSELVLADALSRASLRDNDIDVNDNEYVNTVYVESTTQSCRKELCELTAQDESLQLIAWYVRKGWPEHNKLCPDLIKPYWNVRHELSEHEGMLFRGEQIVVPYAYQKRALTCLHTGHLGTVKCTEGAKTTLYWPGYVRDIQEMVERCSRCQANRNVSAHEPLIPTPVPEYPFQKVGADLFTLDGVTYLLNVDYYSKWLYIAPLHDTKSIDVIRELKRIFADFGSPEILVTDGGPQFGSHEFRRFASDWLVQHTMSSPAYSRSNGQPERMVQTAKNLLRKCSQDNTDYQQGLLALRDTPIANNLPSPAELLQGRRLRGNLPIVTVAKRFPKGYSSVNVNDVLDALKDIKLGKHDGKYSLTSDHVVNSSRRFLVILSILMSSMLVHGYNAADLLSSTIISIPKDARGDMSRSDNYRGIALCNSICKIFDIILMKKCSDVLCTSDQQFAFKANHSTTLCTGILMETATHFVNNNSCVYSCFLDASKAFDKVHYGKLFNLMLKRGVPSVIVRFILDGYIRQRMCAQWERHTSRSFHVCNGVKQGAVISPILFAVYYDELIAKLARSGYGCVSLSILSVHYRMQTI